MSQLKFALLCCCCFVGYTNLWAQDPHFSQYFTSPMTMNPALTLLSGSPGEYYWGGAATTSFFIDPAEELITIFMTQVLPSSAYPVRRELRTMVYSAITDSNL